MPIQRPPSDLSVIEYLQIISKWKLPPSGEFSPGGLPYTYGYCYGSNGEREYMQQVARYALARLV